MKVYTMHVFAKMNNDDESVHGDSGTLSPSSTLSNLVIMLATKAADCGVSSKLC
jgi:hypothetical protein